MSAKTKKAATKGAARKTTAKTKGASAKEQKAPAAKSAKTTPAKGEPGPKALAKLLTVPKAKKAAKSAQRERDAKVATSAAAAVVAAVDGAKVKKATRADDIVTKAEAQRIVAEKTKRTPAPDAAELPELLRTTMGVRWTRILREKGWTLDTLPQEKLVHITGRMTVPALVVLLDVSEARLREVCEAKGVTLKAGGGRVRSGAPRSGRARRSTSSGDGASSTGVAAPQRPLVDDVADAVPLETLDVGERFKTPDSPKEGLRGWIGTVVRKGIGSVTVLSGGRPDSIALSTLVVRLAGESDARTLPIAFA